MVTGSTTSCIVCGTGGAGGGGRAYDTGNDSLAGRLLDGATTGLHLLREGAQGSMLIAVEQRLGPVQPKPNRPVEGTEKTQLCTYTYEVQHKGNCLMMTCTTTGSVDWKPDTQKVSISGE